MWNLKYDTNEDICETDSQTQSTDIWLPKGERGAGGKDWEVGIGRYNLVYMQDGYTTMCNTGNYVQYPVINHNEKEYEEEYVFITLFITYTSIIFLKLQ